MSTLSNKPTLEELVDRVPLFPLLTYESLADFTGVKPGSMREEWMFAFLESSWEESLKYMQEMSTKVVANYVCNQKYGIIKVICFQRQLQKILLRTMVSA